MRRAVLRIVRLILALPLVACATAPSETAPPERVAHQAFADVCLPLVADGVAFDTVKRLLDVGWSQDWPELLTSDSPGPVMRQRFGPAQGVLGVVPERLDPPYGLPNRGGCNVVVRGDAVPGLTALVAEGLSERQAIPRSDQSGFIVAAFCVTGAARPVSVWVLDYRDGRMGIAVNAATAPCS